MAASETKCSMLAFTYLILWVSQITGSFDGWLVHFTWKITARLPSTGRTVSRPPSRWPAGKHWMLGKALAPAGRCTAGTASP